MVSIVDRLQLMRAHRCSGKKIEEDLILKEKKYSILIRSSVASILVFSNNFNFSVFLAKYVQFFEKCYNKNI